MPSFQTICRAVMMLAVGVVVVKSWHLYGPTNEQVKTACTKGVELVQSAIESRRPAASSAAPDPRLAAPRGSGGNQAEAAVAVAPALAPPLAPVSQGEAPKLLPESGGPPVTAIQSPAGPPAEKSAQAAGTNGDRISELMAHLKQLGAAETKLAPWGSDGKLYRFSCRAPLANAPAMTQHFESVAAEPSVAVEQVLAKVEAWRVAQRDGGRLRY